MKHIIHIIITTLICILGWQLGRLSVERSERKEQNKNFYSEYTYPEVFSIVNNDNNILIDSVEDGHKEKIRFQHIADSTDLFVYYSTYSCTPCREMTLHVISDLKYSHPNIRISVLISSIANRDLLVHTQQYDRKFKFFKINKIPFKTIDNQEIISPVLFQIDNKGLISNCYMTEFEDINGLKDYIQRFISNN